MRSILPKKGGGKINKRLMIIDLEKCSGCYNCFLACRDEYYGNDYPPISLAQPFTGHFWMRILERERGKYPKVKVSFQFEGNY